MWGVLCKNVVVVAAVGLCLSCQEVPHRAGGVGGVALPEAFDEAIRPGINIALFETPVDAPPAVQIDAYHIPFELKARFLKSGFWSAVRRAAFDNVDGIVVSVVIDRGCAGQTVSPVKTSTVES